MGKVEGCFVSSGLHGDNGATLKATTVLAMLNWLGIEPSYSRPRVSDDNAYAEALFRTAKYRPEFPARGFAGLDAARDWAMRFVHWYNEEHRHSGIGYVTPAQRHAGEDRTWLAARHDLYQQARRANPARWSGETRNWTPVGVVTLNPERDTVIRMASSDSQLSGSVGAPALVRSSRPKRPGLETPRPWRAAKGKRGAEPPGATRSALLGASMKRVGPRSGPTSTRPSPE